MLSALRRDFGFVRHVPPAQLLARVRLIALRRIGRVFHPSLGKFPAQPAAAPPGPIFPARTAKMERTGEGWAFSALGHRALFSRRIDWGRRGPAGRDQLWRMTLHYMEFLEALDDGDFEDLVGQWIVANPPYKPGADTYSWNAYALSLRTVVWMQQIAVRAQDMAPATLSAARSSLAQQLDYLDRHLELDIGGNHLIKNIKALLWGSRFFSGARADRWRAKALVLLHRELGRQMLPDGMHFERSPSYHCQVLADLIEIKQVLPGSAPIGTLLDRVLEKALRVALDLSHPDGRVAQFSDAGLTMAYTSRQCRDALKPADSVSPTNGPFAYPDAGYFGFRTPDHFFVADAGPIAPDNLPAHGHGDIGSFEWSLCGQRMIVDQGVFQYVAGQARSQSRACASHNTLAVSGMDQAEFFGAFRSAHRASLVRRAYRPGEDGVSLELAHDGFVRRGGAVHHRRFDVQTGGFAIEDRLEGGKPLPATVTLLLHPAVTPTFDREGDNGQVTISHARGRARIAASHPLEIEPWVWWPDIGTELETRRLRMDVPAGERAGRMTITILDTAT